VALSTVLLFACFAVLHFYPLAGSTWDKIKEKPRSFIATKNSASWKRTATSWLNNFTQHVKYC